MSYLLDGTEIPRPKEFSREYTPVSQRQTTISGKTGLDYRKLHKEVYTLRWEVLSKAEIDTILTILDKKEIVTFSISENNLTISEINVIVNISAIEYSVQGDNYIGSLELKLTQEE